MPSLVSSPRALLETLLRGLVIGLLGWSLLVMLRQNSAGGPVAGVRSAGLDSALVRWSRSATPSAVEARLEYPPSAIVQDWLAALPGAGTKVSWTGPDLIPSALSLLPVADPAGGFDLAVAAPSGSNVVVGDPLGRRDTVSGMAAGVRMHLTGATPGAAVQIGSVNSRVTPRDSLTRGRILVLGSAGWEGKFVAAALEERGWVVDLHFALSPRGDVAQGLAGGAGASAVSAPSSAPMAPPPSAVPTPGRMQRGFPSPSAMMQSLESSAPTPSTSTRMTIDTARYSVVIALDSTAAREAGRISRFVRSGGGLILWPEAAASPDLRGLAAGGAGEPDREPGRKIVRPMLPESLSIRPVVDLVPDAIAIERRGSQITLAAHRVGLGRVAQTANVEFWRMRMAGDETSVDRHRTWLARVVASVAYTKSVPLPGAPSDGAPLAALVDKLGPPVATPALSGVLRTQPLAPWVIIVAGVALLLELLSRRLRSRP